MNHKKEKEKTKKGKHELNKNIIRKEKKKI